MNVLGYLTDPDTRGRGCSLQSLDMRGVRLGHLSQVGEEGVSPGAFWGCRVAIQVCRVEKERERESPEKINTQTLMGLN